MRQVMVYKTQHGDWIAECPSLPRCVCREATKTEAIDAIKEMIDATIDELKAQNAPIPDDEFEAAIVLV